MNSKSNVDLRAIAREVMQTRGFQVDFPPSVMDEVRSSSQPAANSPKCKDLTSLLWSSIDNDDSKDLDQIEYSETIPGGTRVYVGIADVISLVKKDSATDIYAQQNTTSVYTGVEIFPMLPQKFSTDLTSLNEGQTRLAFVVEMEFSDQGDVTKSDVYRALVLNKAQLTYHGVTTWLEKMQPPYSTVTDQVLEKIIKNPALQEQILQQDKVAQLIREKRFKDGALDFRTVEVSSSIREDGKIELANRFPERASHIIEEFMIASNESVDSFLEAKKFPCIQRIVRTPKNWSRIVEIAADLGEKLPSAPDGKALQQFLAKQQTVDPDRFAELSLSIIKLLGRGEYVLKTSDQEGLGHFGLAAANYSHSTAPNRRYPDLITQRLLESASNGLPSPYSNQELDALATHCTLKEDDANKVERQIKKSIAAVALSSKIGETYSGTITGASDKGVFIRILNPAVEGKIEGNTRGVRVGDKVQVKLTSTDPYRGFIDFRLV